MNAATADFAALKCSYSHDLYGTIHKGQHWAGRSCTSERARRRRKRERERNRERERLREKESDRKRMRENESEREREREKALLSTVNAVCLRVYTCNCFH